MQTHNTNSKLVVFLYTLMRDRVPPGEVALIVRDMVPDRPVCDYVLSNGYLAAYAEELAAALMPVET